MSNKNSLYDFKLDYVVEEIRRCKHQKILIQLPDGMKNYITKIINYLEGRLRGVKFYVSTSPTYGACDVAEDEASRLGVDLIIHFGHTPYPLYPKPRVKTIYIECFINIKPSKRVVNKLVEKLHEFNAKRVGLASSLQYIKYMNYLALELARHGFIVVIGSSIYSDLMYRGQILGCEYSCIKNIEDFVDVFIVISGGMFHHIGAALNTQKPILALDPHKEEVLPMDKLRSIILKKRYYKIMKALEAKNWALIIGMKPGQFKLNELRELTSLIKEKGGRFIVFTAREINNDVLINIDNESIDAFIILACPRVAIDDLQDYPKPVLTLGEALMILRNGMREYILK